MGNKLVVKGGVCKGCRAGENGERHTDPAGAHKALRGTLKIPRGVTDIGQRAFDHAHGITALELPRSLRTIGAGAFNYCTGLTGTLTIPEGTHQQLAVHTLHVHLTLAAHHQ